MQFHFKIFLGLDEARIASRKILRGISNYSKNNGPWRIFFQPPFYKMHNKINNLKIPNGVDGIITYVTDTRQVETLKKTNLPVVVIPLKKLVTGLPNITENSDKAVSMAMDYFLSLGLENFAYFSGVKDWYWSVQRANSFCNNLKTAGYNVYCYKPPKAKYLQVWDKELPYVAKWLRSLPKPIGILAWNDERGRDIIEACVAEDIAVPDEVAVLGMDNDELVCDLSLVPLSSISFNHENIGYEAASLLHTMMKEKRIICKNLSIEALHIIPRESTDILKIKDKDVVAAIKYIRANTNRFLQVKEVADYLSISSRTLQKKFKKYRNHSLHYEIMQHRIERVCKLLEQTNMMLYQIANRLGFSEVSALSRSFKKIKGMSPLRYRKSILSSYKPGNQNR